MTPIEEAITALEKALEAGPTQAKILARKLSQAGWNAGHADGCESERRQDLTAKKQDEALIACLAAIDEISAPIRTLLDAHAGALRDAEALRAAAREVMAQPDKLFEQGAADWSPLHRALATNTKGAAE